jgi:hypothetical protein
VRARAVVIVLAASIAGSCTSGTESPPRSGPTKGGASTASGTPKQSGSPSPSSSGTTAPSGSGPITIEHLTAEAVAKDGSSTWQSTADVTMPADSLVLVHLMSCCDYAAVPRVTGPGLEFDLAVTHETGEKRHWVFVAANDGAAKSGPITFSFASPQNAMLWVVDAARHTELGNNGLDAIVQTSWQDSQRNAESGTIALGSFEDPERNAAVGFAMAGSGRATDIVPEDGMVETAEIETPGSNLLIDTFWRRGEDTALAATFQDDTGALAIQSWLFLALELRAGA